MVAAAFEELNPFELLEASADIMLKENRRYLGNVLPPVTLFELSKAKARALRERTDKVIIPRDFREVAVGSRVFAYNRTMLPTFKYLDPKRDMARKSEPSSRTIIKDKVLAAAFESGVYAAIGIAACVDCLVAKIYRAYYRAADDDTRAYADDPRRCYRHLISTILE